MEKSYSEKNARVMEIGSYVMMLPALVGIFLTCFLWFMAIASIGNRHETQSFLLFPLLPTAAIIWGIWLFVYYFKHSRDKLAEEKIKNIRTFAF